VVYIYNRFNFDKIPQQRTGCSNLDQRINNSGVEVADVVEILSYDKTCEIAEIVAHGQCIFLNCTVPQSYQMLHHCIAPWQVSSMWWRPHIESMN
jgi:hypothetical protein